MFELEAGGKPEGKAIGGDAPIVIFEKSEPFSGSFVSRGTILRLLRSLATFYKGNCIIQPYIKLLRLATQLHLGNSFRASCDSHICAFQSLSPKLDSD